jgi:hypothetical protein
MRTWPLLADSYKASVRQRGDIDGGQERTKTAMNRGFQTRNAEMDLDRMLGGLVER